MGNRNREPLKILICSLEYSPEISGGVGTHALELSAGLAQAGDSVTVLACTMGPVKHIIEGSKVVHLIPPNSKGGGRKSMTQGILDYNQTLVQFARENIIANSGPPNIIQCYNWITYPAASELSRFFKVPAISTIQYVSQPVERWWGHEPDPEVVAQEKKLFRELDSFIAVSLSIRTLMKDIYDVSEEKVSVIYNATDPSVFLQPAPPEFLARLRGVVSPAGEKIVLYAGRLHPMKGISSLLRSAVDVIETNKNVRYLMAGEPDSQAYAQEFQELFRQNPALKEKIVLLGKVSRRRLAALYSIADVAVVPSVYDPCPYAAIEAMVAGVPLIVSDGGGLNELVEHGRNGLKIPIECNGEGRYSVDPSKLSQATLLLLWDTDFAKRLAVAAREKALATYNRESMISATREAYYDLIERDSAPSEMTNT